MFQLFQSNQMSHLVDAFSHRRESNRLSPFSQELVLVQNHGMGQWLKLELAQQHGIAANISTELPGTFITGLYHQFLKAPIEKDSGYSKNVLTWHIMSVLKSDQIREQMQEPFQPLLNYLMGEGDADLRLFQLSHQLAGLYEQYLIYRPEWIYAWDKGSPGPSICQQQPWQAILWQQIAARMNERHRADLHLELADVLDAIEPDKLPTRISLFGFSSLPPMHLDTFRSLAKKTQIDIYFLNPCQHYWGDIVSTKDIARRSIRDLIASAKNLTGEVNAKLLAETSTDPALSEEDYLEVGNPLLSSMGKQGREFFELLLSEDSLIDEAHFEQTESETILARLKNDVLNLEFGGAFGVDLEPEKRPLEDNDHSIKFHVCHSKAREVEVLLDQLLDCFAKDPSLKPNEIIVMMPDVTEYIPHIQNIFTDKFYYTLADQPSAEYASINNLQLSILNLTHSRLTSVEVIDLLEHPAISRKFELSVEDHTLIRRWITAAAIRWEMDGESKYENWQVPNNAANTWKTGLERLLQGIAMESAAGLWQENLAVDIDPAESRCLGILTHFIALIEKYRQQCSKSWLATEWLNLLNEMNEVFFDPTGPEQLAVGEIIRAAQELTNHTVVAGYDQPLSPRLMNHWLKSQLTQPPQGNSFINGGITFATMVPMRSIPFKVVCLLGMNDRSYPREDRPYGFDLMALDGLKKGDRSRRNDDRYLFLEAVLSANDRLHISYEGKGIKDNKDKPPSVLVGELVEYLAHLSDHNFVTEHPLQPYSHKYYSKEFPELQSYNRQWYLALAQSHPAVAFMSPHLELQDQAKPNNINQLVSLLTNPAQYFFQQRLGVRFTGEDDVLLETESFVQGNLGKYQLAENALEKLISGESMQIWQQELIASGELMKGPTGQFQFNAAVAKAEVVFSNLQLDGEPKEYSGYIDFNTFELSGRITNGYGDEIWNYRTGQLRKRQLLKAWVEHLFTSALGHQVPTRLIATKQGKDVKVANSTLTPIAPSAARDYLGQIAELHQLALNHPLPFLPELSAQWFESTKKGEPETIREKKIMESWNQDRAGIESTNPYYNRLFNFPADLNYEFKHLALQIYTPLMDSWVAEK
jgi:exodeoxyribonuclease V gamma subunit